MPSFSVLKWNKKGRNIKSWLIDILLDIYFCHEGWWYFKALSINTTYGPRQANLVLIAYASSEGSEPSLLAHTSSESRGIFTQKARSLAPLNGWACAVKICHDGMLEDTNSLDGAHIQRQWRSWASQWVNFSCIWLGGTPERRTLRCPMQLPLDRCIDYGSGSFCKIVFATIDNTERDFPDKSNSNIEKSEAKHYLKAI